MTLSSAEATWALILGALNVFQCASFCAELYRPCPEGNGSLHAGHEYKMKNVAHNNDLHGPLRIFHKSACEMQGKYSAIHWCLRGLELGPCQDLDVLQGNTPQTSASNDDTQFAASQKRLYCFALAVR